MILIIHKKAKTVIEVLKDGVHLEKEFDTCTKTFWTLANEYPQCIIAWCEEEFSSQLNLENWNDVFHHDLILASFTVKTGFLPESIGYVDPLLFARYSKDILYASWRMSSDVGGIKGEVLLKFEPLLQNIKNFDYLLNSLAKLGQQNGLFCYSSPNLIMINQAVAIEYSASNRALFDFVSQHYKSFRLLVLLWCFWKYEKEIPFLAFFKSIFRTKLFQKKIDLSDIKIKSTQKFTDSNSIDVIIPTIGRSKHVLNVLEDLRQQILLPKKVIVIEQNPDLKSISELNENFKNDYPFEILHKFIHQTGACNARNLALNEVTGDWVFFCDDDNRFEPDLLQESLDQIRSYGIEVLNTAYIQPGENRIYENVKQWGTFGAGNGIALSTAINGFRFSKVFEHSYGEDVDFGMQLRLEGHDILYHPGIEIIHIKAPMGGFRTKHTMSWSSQKHTPKPSPSLMALMLKYYTKQQMFGSKAILFLKFYSSQSIKNPFEYYNKMEIRWQESKKWALHLMDNKM